MVSVFNWLRTLFNPLDVNYIDCINCKTKTAEEFSVYKRNNKTWINYICCTCQTEFFIEDELHE